jgi:hypothetical protein
VEIKLGLRKPKGLVAIVDEADRDLAELSWYPNPSGYAIRNDGIGKQRHGVFMHRIILERVLDRPLTHTELVDHIDGDPRNNTRANLRLANAAENARNRRLHKNSKTGYKGVSWSKKRSKYIAFISVNRQSTYLGGFVDILDAARAYNEAALKYHGEFALLNVIPSDESVS